MHKVLYNVKIYNSRVFTHPLGSGDKSTIIHKVFKMKCTAYRVLYIASLCDWLW